MRPADFQHAQQGQIFLLVHRKNDDVIGQARRATLLSAAVIE